MGAITGAMIAMVPRRDRSGLADRSRNTGKTIRRSRLATTDPFKQIPEAIGIAGALRGDGKNAWVGWPSDDKMKAMRDAWMDSNDEALRKRLNTEIQLRAFETVPFIPLGQYLPPSPWRGNLSGLLWGVVPVFWNVSKA